MLSQPNVVIFLDFGNAHQNQRNEFADEMANRDWVRFPKSANSFCTRFLNDPSDSTIVRSAESDIDAVASNTGIDDWTAVCVLSD